MKEVKTLREVRQLCRLTPVEAAFRLLKPADAVRKTEIRHRNGSDLSVAYLLSYCGGLGLRISITLHAPNGRTLTLYGWPNPEANLRRFRERLNLTQEAAARRVGVPGSGLAHTEKIIAAGCNIFVNTLSYYARAIGCELRILIDTPQGTVRLIGAHRRSGMPAIRGKPGAPSRSRYERGNRRYAPRDE